jgi:hypothetical protein
MKKVSDIARKSKRPGLFLCGCWFLFLALGSEAFYSLLLSTEKQLSNRLLVTLATSGFAALPSFFACGLLSRSLFVGKEPIEYYQRLINKRSFWIFAGFLSLASSIATIGLHGSTISLDQDAMIYGLQVLCGIVVGIYLVACSSSFVSSGAPVIPQLQLGSSLLPQMQPSVKPPQTSGKAVNVVKASAELRCCVGNDLITVGQEVLECPFCKVKFHEHCARQRNIQQCPICRKRLLITSTSGSRPSQGAQLIRVIAANNLQCCVGNDFIVAGQEVLECPFCKVKFHEHCARQRNIQQCPICNRAITF